MALLPPPPPRDEPLEPPRPSRWRKILGIGCAAVLVLMLAAAVIVQQNWTRISNVYHRAGAVVGTMFHLITTLQNTYGGRVNVQVRTANGGRPFLSVTLTNPPFLEHLDPDAPEGKAKALEVATTARDALPPDSEFTRFEVILERANGSAVKVAKSWAFRFEAADLPPRSAR
jgi:hypothetical protein